MERDLIRERVQAGLTAARARGRVGGRKAKLTDKQVAQARKMLDDPSTTISAVAVKMGVNRLPSIDRSDSAHSARLAAMAIDRARRPGGAVSHVARAG
jgi:DNA invertase Pin-like site-specific DNA recombinase